MKHPVTIVDIAKECGVSIATVSRVLNGTAPVAEGTRARINAAIRRHAYVPNSFAKGLSRQRSMTLGIIMPDIANPYFASLFQEIESAAYESQYSVFLCNTAFCCASAVSGERREIDSFQMMIDKNVDGVLIAGGQADLGRVSPTYLEALQRLVAAVPTVVLGCPLVGVDCRFIQRELGQGVQLAVRHLVELGHRHIGFLGGEKDVGVTEARLAAFVSAMNTAGSLYDKQLVALSNYYAPDGWRAMHALLAKGVPCTAALAMNDHVALGALRALADAGLRVPKDFSLISCDQFFTADYFIPRLTSVNQHNELFGRYVVDTLLRRIRGEDDTDFLPLHPELILRESCAAPAAQT